MADISSLNIQISASTSRAISAIRNLQKELGSLNMSLNNYSEKSEYVRGLQRLATGLTGLGDAVDMIDATKLTNIANAIGDLATKGAKLSGLGVANAFSQMGAAAQQTSERTRKAAKEIANAFDIKGKKGLDDLRASIDRFYASAGDDKALKSASDDIEDTINQYRTYKKVVDETYLAIRKWVSSTNVAMPKGATSEFIDEFNKIRGVIGIKNTGKGGIGFDSMLGEMNEKFGTNFDTSNAVNGLRELAEYLRKGATQQEQYEKSVRASLHTDEEWNSMLHRLYESINQVKNAQTSAMVDENGFLTGEGVDEDLLSAFNGDLIEKEAQQVQTAGQTITNTITDIKQDMVELSGYSNPFQGIVDGLEALQDVHIDAEQFSGVKVLAESLGRLTGVNSEKAGTNIPIIAQGLESLAGIVIPDNAAQLEAYGNAIAKFGTKAAERAQGLPLVAQGLKEIVSIGEIPDVSGIYELAKALAKLGGAKVEVAIENMPRLAASFIELMGSLSKAPNVSDKTVRLAQAMAQLATASRSAGQATKQSSMGVTMWNNALRSALPTFNKATRRTFSLASAFGKLYASYFLVIRGIRKLGEAIEYSSQLTEVQNVVAHTFGEQAELMDEFAERSIKDYGMAELAAKQFASRFQAMGIAMGITANQIGDANDFIAQKIDLTATDYENLGDSMADLSIDLTKLTADYASFFNLDYEDVADDMASIFTGQTRPLRRYGLDLTNATLKEWALKNGLDADIKSMSQAEKTMLRYQYVLANSGHILGDFTRTADTWANVIRTLGQQFQKLGQIIGGGLINLFKPLMIQIREFMYGAIETVQNGINAIGKLLGWQISIENVGITMNDEMEEYADNLDDAAGSAKKLNSQLRAIDELNNLTTSKKGGSGSDDSLLGSLGGLNNKGNEAKASIKYYESEINSWYEFGTKIRDKIIDGLKNINWDDISNKVKDNAKGFSNVLKGLLFPDREGNTLGGEIGAFLAESINLGFDWLSTATADQEVWEASGHNIADFFTHFFEHFDAKDAADAINNIVGGLTKMLTTAIEDLSKEENKSKIVGKVKEFFEGIKPETWGTIAITLGGLSLLKVGKWFIANGIKESLRQSLVEKLSANGVVTSAADGLGIIIGISLLIDRITVSDKVAEDTKETMQAYDIFDEEGLKSYDKWLNDVKKEGLPGVLTLLKEIAAVQFGLPDTSTANNFKNGGIFDPNTDIGKILNNVDDVKGLTEELLNLSYDFTGTEEDYQKYIKTLDDICDRYGITREELRKLQLAFDEFEETPFDDQNLLVSVGRYFENLGITARENFRYALTGHSGGGGGTSFEEDAKPDGESWGLGFSEGVKAKWQEFSAWWQSSALVRWWNEKVAPWFTKEKWSTLADNMKKGITDKWNEFVTWWQNSAIVQWWNNKVRPWFTREKWSSIALGIKDGIGDAFHRFESWWQNTALVQWWNTKVKPWFDKSKWSNLGNGIKDGLDQAFNNAIASIKGIWNTFAGWLNQKLTFEWDEFKVGNKVIIEAGSLVLGKLPTFEYGGFPTPGSLFVAGEAGAELLGTVGGKTAVAGGAEITGIKDAIQASSSEETVLLRAILNAVQNGSTIVLDGKQIASSVRKTDNEFYKRTGRSMFTY